MGSHVIGFALINKMTHGQMLDEIAAHFRRMQSSKPSAELKAQLIEFRLQEYRENLMQEARIKMTSEGGPLGRINFEDEDDDGDNLVQV